MLFILAVANLSLSFLEMLLLNNNSMTGSADGFCEGGPVPSVFGTDCFGTIPEVVCRCCTLCCDDGDDACNSIEGLANLDPIWENSFERKFYKFGADLIFSD